MLDQKSWGVMPWVYSVLFMFRPRLLLYPAGSEVNRVQVILSGIIIIFLCCVQSKTLCKNGCMYYLAAVMVVCMDVIIMSSADLVQRIQLTRCWTVTSQCSTNCTHPPAPSNRGVGACLPFFWTGWLNGPVGWLAR